MTSLSDLLSTYWLEAAPVLIIPWILATIILLIFVANHGWRAVSLWQRWYVMVAGIVLPLFVFFVLLHWWESVDPASHLYGLWLMVLIVLVMLVEWAGIVIGLMLLVKMSGEIVKKVTKTT